MLRLLRPHCVSFPKSGRTWLRHMMNDLEVKLKYSHAGSGHGGRIPVEQLPRPESFLGWRKIVFMHRDPRDTVVSGYYQATQRIHVYSGTMSEFIREPRHGFAKIVAFNRMWLTALHGRADAHVLTYEALLGDTEGELRRVLSFLGVSRSAEQLSSVVNRNRFDNAQKREAARKGTQPDSSFKARRGGTGSWQEEFSADDIRYCDEIAGRG